MPDPFKLIEGAANFAHAFSDLVERMHAKPVGEDTRTELAEALHRVGEMSHKVDEMYEAYLATLRAHQEADEPLPLEKLEAKATKEDTKDSKGKK